MENNLKIVHPEDTKSANSVDSLVDVGNQEACSFGRHVLGGISVALEGGGRGESGHAVRPDIEDVGGKRRHLDVGVRGGGVAGGWGGGHGVAHVPRGGHVHMAFHVDDGPEFVFQPVHPGAQGLGGARGEHGVRIRQGDEAGAGRGWVFGILVAA